MPTRPFSAALAVLCLAASLAFAEPPRPFTVAVFPDTQLYSRDHPDTYEAMCRWIAEHRDAHNIVFVSHIGDIVQNDVEWQWENARRAHDILSEAGIAYGMAIGNHDGRDMYKHHLVGENFLRHFGPATPYDLDNETAGTFAEQPWWAGHSLSGLSNVQMLPEEMTGGIPMMFVHLEVGMRRAEVEWVRDQIAAHPERVAILSTHRYLYDWRTIRGRYTAYQYEQFDPKYVGQDYGASQLFHEVLAELPNVLMVWCGHNDGEFRQGSPNRRGNPVYEMLHDYTAFSPNGGDGWFRLYTFDPARGEVRANTWSPTKGRFRTQGDQIDGLLAALPRLSEEASRRAGMGLSGLDPLVKAAIVGAFSKPGAMSRLISSIQTGEGEFAWVLGAIDQLAGENAAKVRAQVEGFPWDEISPGLVRLLDREGGPIVRAYLDGDQAALSRLFSENGNARLIEAFLSDGDRTPSFTLKIDFDAYRRP